MPTELRRIDHRTFDARQLVTEFPPRIRDGNKRIVHDIACPPGCVHSGRITYSRWSEPGLPASVDRPERRPEREGRPDYFGYEPLPDGSPADEWYLNFAHHDVFAFYGGPLFAQDEMQVAEHPALGSLREALEQSDARPWTVENGRPTPILVRGVERRCRVATDVNAEQGRPRGLYGNHFAAASAEAVTAAARAIVPPTVSNILAIEAPPGGSGRYTRGQVEYILNAAYTGFRAARLESIATCGESVEVVVHTGFWGCGAYGGNRIFMTLLQLLAAEMAGLHRVVFHAGDEDGLDIHTVVGYMVDRFMDRYPDAIDVTDILDQATAMEYQWGVSDGN